MRRLPLVTAASASVLLGLVGNLATGTLEVPRAWVPWVWAATAALCICVIVYAGSQRPIIEEDLKTVSGRLAGRILAQWQTEEERQWVFGAYRLPVAWDVADHNLLDHWANVRLLPPGADAEPMALAGRLDQPGRIADVYSSVPSRRMVVLGRAGAGKTVLCLRFVLAMLERRPDEGPVPVIFSIGSWDAGTTGLREWLAGQLTRDHPDLAGTGPGGTTLAEDLVSQGRILPVLDGFDELADGLHGPALEELKRTALPFLLTSRSDEYGRAVDAAGVLTGAAVVVLADLTMDDLAGYLPQVTSPATGAGPWDNVLRRLRGPAGGPLRSVLSTPLMVGLVRAVYSGTSGPSPDRLLAANPSEIEDQLVREFLSTAYAQPSSAPLGRPGNWDAERARRWLRHLAAHLDTLGTPDLAWWRLRDTVPRAERVLVLGLALGPLSGLALGRLYGGAVGVAFGIATGLAFGLAAGRPNRGPDPVRAGFTLRGRGRDLVEHLAIGLGLGFGLMLGLGFDPVQGLVAGLAFGTVSGMAFGVSGNVKHRHEDATSGPFEVLRADRAAGLVAGLPTGVVVGTTCVFALGGVMRTEAALIFGVILGFGCVVAPGVTIGTIFGLAGGIDVAEVIDFEVWLSAPTEVLIVIVVGVPIVLGVGIAAGPMAGLGFSAWAQWVLLVRLWLPLTGRLPWSVGTFLTDACGRGVLRQSGAAFQFRHVRLQDHLLGRLQGQAQDPAPAHRTERFAAPTGDER